MRTHCTTHGAPDPATGERPDPFSEFIDWHRLPTSLADTLAAADLRSLTITRRDGSTVTYSAIEYRCLNCDTYGHDDKHCPENEDDYDDQEA